MEVLYAAESARYLAVLDGLRLDPAGTASLQSAVQRVAGLATAEGTTR